MNINVEIENLILDGFTLTQRERLRLKASVEAELGRLLAADGLAAHLLESGDVPHLQGGAFQYHPGQDAGTLGKQIAQAVYEGIGK